MKFLKHLLSETDVHPDVLTSALSAVDYMRPETQSKMVEFFNNLRKKYGEEFTLKVSETAKKIRRDQIANDPTHKVIEDAKPVAPASTVEDTVLFQFLAEAKMPPKLPSKPRNKHLHDVLLSKKGGAIPSEKTDFNRAKEKQKTQQELTEEGAAKRFSYTAWKDGKATASGYIDASDVVDARKKVLIKHPGTQKAEAKEVPR